MTDSWSEGDNLAEEWHDLLGRYHRTMCALDRALLAGHDLTVSDFEVLHPASLVAHIAELGRRFTAAATASVEVWAPDKVN